jgi:hypothetical protein
LRLVCSATSPRFAASYQTAAFFAARVALYNAFPDANTYRDSRCPEEPAAKTWLRDGALDQARLDRWLSQPRLYELGRTRAIDLRDAVGTCTALARCDDIHARGGDLYNVRGLLAAFAMVRFGAGPVAAEPRDSTGARRADAFDRRRRQRAPAAGQRLPVLLPSTLALIFLTMVLVQMVVSVRDVNGEPFAWLEGVSAWPSEVIRWFALLLGHVLPGIHVPRHPAQRRRPAERFHIPLGEDARSTWQRISRTLSCRGARTPGCRVPLRCGRSI